MIQRKIKIKMNVTESNRLIAEFLNVLPNKGGEYEMYGVIDCIEDDPKEKHFFFASEMFFHESWDWLMPVVDKIESIVLEDDNSFNVTIGATNYCVIQDSYGELLELSDIYGKTKLLTVYLTVVEFIEWYNEQKEK